MTCPSCIVALAGTETDSITSRLGPTGIMVALGAVLGLVGYAFVPKYKVVGLLGGAAAGAGIGWYMTKPIPNSAGPLPPGPITGGLVTPPTELPPEVSVPPSLPEGSSKMAPAPVRLPAPVMSSVAVTRVIPTRKPATTTPITTRTPPTIDPVALRRGG